MRTVPACFLGKSPQKCCCCRGVLWVFHPREKCMQAKCACKAAVQKVPWNHRGEKVLGEQRRDYRQRQERDLFLPFCLPSSPLLSREVGQGMVENCPAPPTPPPLWVCGEKLGCPMPMENAWSVVRVVLPFLLPPAQTMEGLSSHIDFGWQPLPIHSIHVMHAMLCEWRRKREAPVSGSGR